MTIKTDHPYGYCPGCKSHPAAHIHVERTDDLARVERERDELRAKLKRWEAIDLGKIDAVNELRAENERLRSELASLISAAEGWNTTIAEATTQAEQIIAENDRLKADVRELNGMVAMLNEQLIEWKRRAEVAEFRVTNVRQD